MVDRGRQEPGDRRGGEEGKMERKAETKKQAINEKATEKSHLCLIVFFPSYFLVFLGAFLFFFFWLDSLSHD